MLYRSDESAQRNFLIHVQAPNGKNYGLLKSAIVSASELRR